MTKLLIVESPSKAKTISAMLGTGWKVRASMGHVRDLPPKDLGVRRSDGTPEYTPTVRGREVLAKLGLDARSASAVFLATDPDREGEAIAWHLAESLHLKPGSFSRVTYHEITEKAIRKALSEPRALDLRLVDAQQARRVLDRVVGYTVSPKLWDQARNSGLRLSAGRVQTPTLRLVVERDRAIAAFRPTQHFGAQIDLSTATPFTATWDTKPYQKSADEPYVLDRALAESAAAVTTASVKSCVDGTRAINSPPPFTTSALQQAASAQLDFSPEHTMDLAQALFETHHAITYHRTDSVHMADEAVADIRDYAAGKGYPLPASPNRHATKSKNAQEAHEAIRPTDPSAEAPHGVTGDALALYRLIHRQAVASQLAPCRLSTRSIRLASPDGRFEYEARGQTVVEPGFTVLTGAPKETSVPAIAVGAVLPVSAGRVLDQQTKPPSRYTEGSLIADLERRGIGRPSTWAAILKNIKDRGYITVKGKQVFSTPVGGALVDALADLRFAGYDYTANLEEELDRIASGESRYADVVLAGWSDLDEDLASHLHPLTLPAGATATSMPSVRQGKGAKAGNGRSTKGVARGVKCPTCGSPMKKRSSARGAFYGCTKYPDCRGTRPA